METKLSDRPWLNVGMTRMGRGQMRFFPMQKLATVTQREEVPAFSWEIAGGMKYPGNQLALAGSRPSVGPRAEVP